MVPGLFDLTLSSDDILTEELAIIRVRLLTPVDGYTR